MDAESLMAAKYVSEVQNLAQMKSKTAQVRTHECIRHCGRVTNTRNKDK